MLRLTVVLCACLLALPALAQKKPLPTYERKPDQKAIAENVPKAFVAAAQPCDNFAWAAAVEMLLHPAQVKIPLRDWVMKAYGGYRCISPLSVSDYESLLLSINGDYALTPERKVRITAEFTRGAPTSADDLILSFRAGQPLLLVWKGKPYVWYGIIYDEYVHPTQNKLFEIRELKLLDPLAKTEKERYVSFVKGKDDVAGIDGVMRVVVAPR